MKLIVGLGNPGKKYDNTRHNFGFMVIDNYIKKNNIKLKMQKKSEYEKVKIFNCDVIFLKPQTFMNLSGESIWQIVDFYKIKTEDILIIYDDLDSDFGKIKIKNNSSSGGHNGVKSIINHLKTQKFPKLKLGINNEYKRDVSSFVLSKFSKNELEGIDNIFNTTEDIITDFITGKTIEDLMNKYN